MCTLPETNKSNLKMDGWKMIVSFWGPAQPGNLRSVSFREDSKVPPTWRITAVSKWLVTPIYKPFRPFVRGTTPVRGLTITMVINHLQVMGWSSKYPPERCSWKITDREVEGWFPQPKGWFPQPKRWFPQPKGWFPQPKGWFPQPKGWFPQPKRWFPQPKGWFPQPKGWFPQPKGWFPQPKGWFPQPKGWLKHGLGMGVSHWGLLYKVKIDGREKPKR